MGGAGEMDPVEDALLAGLEQLAQKTYVITRWADEMYEFVKNVPQSAFLFILTVFLARHWRW
jgi:serine/threonine-protein kinase ULK/ATG1